MYKICKTQLKTLHNQAKLLTKALKLAIIVDSGSTKDKLWIVHRNEV